MLARVTFVCPCKVGDITIQEPKRDGKLAELSALINPSNVQVPSSLSIRYYQYSVSILQVITEIKCPYRFRYLGFILFHFVCVNSL